MRAARRWALGFGSLAALVTPLAAHAQPTDQRSGDQTTSIVHGSDPHLDLPPPLPGDTALWTGLGPLALGPLGQGTSGVLTRVGSFGGSRPSASSSFLWANRFAVARISPTYLQLTLRTPPLAGFYPTLSISSLQGALGDFGLAYVNGPLHAGWQLYAAAEPGGPSLTPLVTSVSYVRYEVSKWDLGLSHVALLRLSDARVQGEWLAASGGIHPSPSSASMRFSSSIPLRVGQAAGASGRAAIVGAF